MTDRACRLTRRTPNIWHGVAMAALMLIVVLTAAPAPAAELGTFGGWTAFADGKGKSRVCYIGAEPQKSAGKYTKRGSVYALITHRLSDKTYYVVSFQAGYPFAGQAEVDVTIDDKTVRLFTNGETAWAYDPKDDRAMVKAMRAGADMVVKGASKRGTATTDTYSLKGVTLALRTIGKACGVK